MTAQTITEFIAERLAEDETAARAALPAEHECFHNETRKWWASGDRVRVVSRCGCPTIENTDDTERANMARRVLREVAAKRAILDLHRPEQLTARLICDECSDGYEVMEWAPDYPCDTVRTIALVYAGHPDYDESWRA